MLAAALLCVTPLGAPAPLQPPAGGLHLEGRLHCVSTAVDIKSERCDKACNGRESGLSCPSKCLCVRVPWPGAPQTVKSAKSVLHRLAKGLKKMPAAHRQAQMKAARATAAHAMHVLSLEQRAESPCKSQVPGVSDESCATLCVVRASCPEVCACEDDGSKEDGHVLKIDVDVSKKPKDWISGYYAWGWSAKPSNGTKGSNLGVQFSGDISVQGALHGVGAITLPCDETQSGFCKGQMDFFTGAGKTKTEAKEAVLKQYADNCRSCLMTKTDMARLPKKQFSVKAGVWRGKQLLSLGGGGTMWNVESLSGLTAGSKDIQDIKEAGFAGICFDIEETEGEQELIDAFEATFAMLQKEGLEVMVTTSHSAPYEASSDEARIGLVDAWVRSPNIDYLSPQLYTTGGEGAEFAASTGQLGDVGYEHYVGAKAKFVPSIVSESQVDEVREYFAEKGIEVAGFVQWQPYGGGGAIDEETGLPEVPEDPNAGKTPEEIAAEVNCMAHGICGVYLR